MALLEVACNGINAALAAQEAGAHRIELFSSLGEGGITASHGMLSIVREKVSLPIYAMIRPRGGDFCYNKHEVMVMEKDIEFCKAIGMDGLVFGCLKEDGTVNMLLCKQLLSLAAPLKVTFHRAYDVCAHPDMAFEQIIDLGFERVLSSGRQANAPSGATHLKQLQEKAKGRIKIMAGAGINASNIKALAEQTAIQEFHATARMMVMSGFSQNTWGNEMTRHWESDADEIQDMLQVLNTL